MMMMIDHVAVHLMMVRRMIGHVHVWRVVVGQIAVVILRKCITAVEAVGVIILMVAMKILRHGSGRQAQQRSADTGSQERFGEHLECSFEVPLRPCVRLTPTAAERCERYGSISKVRGASRQLVPNFEAAEILGLPVLDGNPLNSGVGRTPPHPLDHPSN